MAAHNAETVVLLDTLYRWVRTHLSHGAQHPSAAAMDQAVLEAALAAKLPVTLQYLLSAVFRNRQLVAMTPEEYARSGYIASALRHAGAQEIVFEEEATAEALNKLGGVLARAVPGPTAELDDLELEGIHWRTIPHAQRGLEQETVDADTAATIGVVMGFADAERLPTTGPWSWAEGMDLVRRLENALDSSAPAALIASECAPGDWTVQRRAVSGTLLALAVLRDLEVSTATARAVAHVTLILCCRGLEPRAGQPLRQIAAAVRSQLWNPEQKVRCQPHHLRVAALVDGLVQPPEARAAGLGVAALVELVYGLESRRVSRQHPEPQSRLELIASALAEPAAPREWLRAVIATLGALPLGTTVALADGRIGLVSGRGPTPWRPEVQIDGQPTIAPGKVRPLSQRPIVGAPVARPAAVAAAPSSARPAPGSAPGRTPSVGAVRPPPPVSPPVAKPTAPVAPVNGSLLAWPMHFIVEQVWTHIDTAPTVEMLRYSQRQTRIVHKVLDAFRVNDGGRVELSDAAAPHLPGEAVVGVAAWAALFLAEAERVAGAQARLDVRAVTRLMGDPLEQVGFYVAFDAARDAPAISHPAVAGP